MTAFLGVEHSATGRRWQGPDAAQDRAALALAQASGLPDAMCRVLARLGVAAPAVEGFLSPSLRELMPDPSTLRDMDRAAERIAGAVEARQRIAIFADYDVDGATSAALLHGWLGAHGLNATIYVPDRLREGYGPNAGAMRALAAEHDLIVCVDCGTLAHEPIAAAAGTDVIVLDHHLGAETLPPALAVVNPNRQDESGALSCLCAAGVAFLCLVAASRVLRGRGREGPDLLSSLDLVALATVADVAPLHGLNRAFVRQGLRVMARRARPGLRALADVAGLDRAPTPYHLGFLFGPRINAGGRIGKADLGARLLTTGDAHEAEALAERLDALNAERRAIEERITDAALAQAEARGFDAPLVWAAGEGWHPGVVGIVASRLKEAARRPAVVIGIEHGKATGSGRSVRGIDLGATVARLAAEGLIEKGGGHRMAAGLSLGTEAIGAAMERLGALLGAAGSGTGGPPALRIDAALAPRALTTDLVEMLDRAGPFGADAPAPRFALPGMRIAFAARAGETHLRLSLRDGAGDRLDAIAFNAFRGPLGPMLQNHDGAAFHVAGQPEIDTWGGRRKVKLRLEDASPA